MKIGILGAGAMGSGIAQVFAMNGNYSIYLCDLTEELAEKGKKSIDKTLAYQVKKGKMTDSEKNAILDRITIGTKEIFKDADLIIEAVKENMQIKKEKLYIQYVFPFCHRNEQWPEPPCHRHAFLQSCPCYAAG